MRYGEPGWFASLLGAAVLIAGGFALGLVAGVVSEEPELVVGHLVGRSEEVDWRPEGGAEFTDASSEVASMPIEAFESEMLPAPAAPDGVSEPGFLAVDDEPGSRTVEPPGAPLQPELPAVAAAPPARREAPPLRDVSSIPEATARAGFSVQVGAFADGGAAEDVRQLLRSRGFDSYVIPASTSGDGKWRVRVGPVPSKADAEALASRLKSEERLPTWVLSEGGG